MIKTKIKFADIKAGDLIEVVDSIHGVKTVDTGVAFEKQEIEHGFTDWLTSQGGLLVSDSTLTGTVYRLTLGEVFFGDIQAGDRVRVSEKVEGRVESVEDTAHFHVGAMNGYWLNPSGAVVLFEHTAPDVERTIEILERSGE